MTRADAAWFEVSQGMNLLAEDAEAYDLNQSQFSLGLGSYLEIVRYDEEKDAWLSEMESLDLSLLFDIGVSQIDLLSSDSG